MSRQLHDRSREKGGRQDINGSWAPLALAGIVSGLATILTKMPQTSADTASFVLFRATFAHLERCLTVAYGAP